MRALREMGVEEIVVGARRVAMGDWVGDPDVTLGLGGMGSWGGEWGWCGEGAAGKN